MRRTSSKPWLDPADLVVAPGSEWIHELDRLLNDDLLRSSARVYRSNIEQGRRLAAYSRRRLMRVRWRLLGRWLSRRMAATHQYPFAPAQQLGNGLPLWSPPRPESRESQ